MSDAPALTVHQLQQFLLDENPAFPVCLSIYRRLAHDAAAVDDMSLTTIINLPDEDAVKLVVPCDTKDVKDDTGQTVRFLNWGSVTVGEVCKVLSRATPERPICVKEFLAMDTDNRLWSVNMGQHVVGLARGDGHVRFILSSSDLDAVALTDTQFVPLDWVEIES